MATGIYWEGYWEALGSRTLAVKLQFNGYRDILGGEL